ncbi:response regulator [[Actinomadura] parvosata]|uniref:response regulator n=1 Tax=[Actinomadura] parvosata TaxID=1955412 RepID=UPI0012BCF0C5|nr:response regulator [Nonomuraea sp. ATCC 55076]
MSVLVAPLGPGDRVAVVDDSADDAERTAEMLIDCEFEPVIVPLQYPNIDALLDAVAKKARGLVCDHRLSRGAYVNFDGAQVVAASNSRKIPAVLISGYINLDESSSIRRYRAGIPRLLSKRFEPEDLTEALFAAQREQQLGPAPDRVSYRTLVRVTKVRTDGIEPIAEVIIPAWNPTQKVELSTSLITDCVDVSCDELVGMRFMAEVNIYALSHEDLYFSSFQVATPPPDSWLGGVVSDIEQ